MSGPSRAGLYEALLTRRVQQFIDGIPTDDLVASIDRLANAESADRVSRHIAQIVASAIESSPEEERASRAVFIASKLLEVLAKLTSEDLDVQGDELLDPGAVLRSVLQRRPDGTPEVMERPLTPLLDTTVLTNAPGEPSVGHELRAEIPSADSVDALVAFIRWSGVRNLVDALRRHHQSGKRIRILTTTYTNSTEQRALNELTALGAEVRVSYDTSLNRLHAKAWLFHRESGYSTAYLGSSNLTHSAQVTGLEWNVRLSQVRNPDAIAKMSAVFDSYWESPDFVPYDADEFRQRTALPEAAGEFSLSPIEVVLRPFQEGLLDQLAVAREQGHHRNLLVAATGTGKTVMAAVDYARLRSQLPRDRLLFVAHRDELLEQARGTFRHVLRDAAFGERWVGRDRPEKFDHVFASIQSLNSSGLQWIDPEHFDVVVVDEFHHAAANSYAALLARLQPTELLGLTATPERADGLDILSYFDGRIAAELRLWDAIDQQYLVPFDYFGIHDGVDLTGVPWHRGRGYDVDKLTSVLTADHAWANRVIEQVRQKITDPFSMHALGFCVGIGHAKFMAERFNRAGLPSVAVWGETPTADRHDALRALADGRIVAVFAVDLFNEGIDVPNVDTLLMLRPTDSATLFLQQLGRGLRKSHGKSLCTVLDFVGEHRKEFRYDRRFRALLGGSRSDVEDQVKRGFPFLPSGCMLELDPVARDIVLRSIRSAIPSMWREKVQELRSLGDVTLVEYLNETGLELEDIYSGSRSWTELRRAAGLETLAGSPGEEQILRALGRLLHIDDPERIDSYRRFIASEEPPESDSLEERDRRLLRMLVASVTTVGSTSSMSDALSQIWSYPQARWELRELLDVLPGPVGHVDRALGLDHSIPIRAHARYTRLEILAAFGVGEGARPHSWQSGVYFVPEEQCDLFAFTLDKSSRGFSPTTRYRDYAVSRSLIHWESQSTTSVDSKTGQRYINHEHMGSRIVLFARPHANDRALWCLGTARYRSHSGNRPIAFEWELEYPLPADLFTAFAAAVA